MTSPLIGRMPAVPGSSFRSPEPNLRDGWSLAPEGDLPSRTRSDNPAQPEPHVAPNRFLGPFVRSRELDLFPRGHMVGGSYLYLCSLIGLSPVQPLCYVPERQQQRVSSELQQQWPAGVSVCEDSQRVVPAPVHPDAGSGPGPSIGRAAAVGVDHHSVAWKDSSRVRL